MRNRWAGHTTQPGGTLLNPQLSQKTANVKQALARCKLPIMTVASGLKRALKNSHQLVLTASPGAGKTTIVPLIVLETLPPEIGRIIVAQPRRVAVRSAARYVASLLGEKVGETVGWRMRADTKISAQTRIEFTTTGTLLRRLLNEPDLPGIGAIILDEIHERHLDADLALAFTLDIAIIRDDLRIIAMSATADAERFAELLTQTLGETTPIISATQTPHPLTENWVPPREHGVDARGLSAEFIQHLGKTSAEAFTQHGSTLVFVDSIANAERLTQLLQDNGFPAFSLHSQIAATEQDAILAPSAEKKIIVATEIAETSLTVPGVNCVVDGGASRTPRFDAGRQTTHLVTVGASRSAMVQRAGRANRTGPGVVYRAYSQTDFARARVYSQPEIQGADLTEAVLLAHAWSAPSQLALLDRFPAAALTRAQENLQAIGAITADLQVSASGRILAQIPTDPRLAHGLLSAVAWGISPREAARVAATGDTQLAGRLEKLVARFGAQYREIVASGDFSISEGDAQAIILGAAYPQWIARQIPTKSKLGVSRFTTVAGFGVEVEAGTLLGESQWIAIGELQGINGVIKVRCGAPISEILALKLASFRLREQRIVKIQNDCFKAFTQRYLGELELSAVQVPLETADIYQGLGERLGNAKTDSWIRLFAPSEKALRFIMANNYLAERDPSFVFFDDELIAANLELFLGNSLEDLRNGGELREVDVLTGAKLILGWDRAQLVEQLIPVSIRVPSGRKVPVAIDSERGPTISVKLQECFGWRNVPQVLGKQISIELLSPAGRPLAVTGDLTHFFDEVYGSVRGEMRGRYPKHPWPENPWEAMATEKTNRAL